jgi:hypothetical protein
LAIIYPTVFYVAVLLARLQQPGADKSGFDLRLAAIGDLA